MFLSPPSSAGLNGLAVLKDVRALPTGFRYATLGNRTAVRAAAITLIGATGKGDPRSFPLVSEAFQKGAERPNSPLLGVSGDALVTIGDPRTADLLDQVSKRADDPQLQEFILRLKDRLKKGS